MPEAFEAYSPSISALGLLGALYLVQLLIADVVAIRRKHVPGTPVAAGHDDFLFRSVRAHANTTESIGAAILISGFAMLAGGDPGWVNATIWCFVGFRVLHTLAYYFDLRTFRSVAFGLAIASLLVLLGVGVRAQ